MLKTKFCCWSQNNSEVFTPEHFVSLRVVSVLMSFTVVRGWQSKYRKSSSGSTQLQNLVSNTAAWYIEQAGICRNCICLFRFMGREYTFTYFKKHFAVIGTIYITVLNMNCDAARLPPWYVTSEKVLNEFSVSTDEAYCGFLV